MEFHWNDNPLKSYVSLDDIDREKLKYALYEERVYEIVGSVVYSQEDDLVSLKQLLEEVYQIKISSEDVSEMENYLRDGHMGDCTCVACSCMQCYSESLLGVTTIEGIGQQSLRYIDGLFRQEGATIDSVIDQMDTAAPIERTRPSDWTMFTQEQYESFIPGWEHVREQAKQWLKSYKQRL